VPFSELRYAEFARRFGWTPDQVDSIPLVLEPWLLFIDDAMNEAENNHREAIQAAAEAKAGRHRR
jgi:hypothetical protein